MSIDFSFIEPDTVRLRITADLGAPDGHQPTDFVTDRAGRTDIEVITALLALASVRFPLEGPE